MVGLAKFLFNQILAKIYGRFSQKKLNQFLANLFYKFSQKNI
jgi:hypothetical protein